VIARYYRAEHDAVNAQGWFDTGDVAILHPDGTLQITDRTKDVIKSGGEWISSVELENAAISHPALAQAAAIGLPHPRWDERPAGRRLARGRAGERGGGDRPSGEPGGQMVATRCGGLVEALPLTATGKSRRSIYGCNFRILSGVPPSFPEG
jgi:fatty-acyl-CoA synthase